MPIIELRKTLNKISYIGIIENVEYIKKEKVASNNRNIIKPEYTPFIRVLTFIFLNKKMSNIVWNE